MENVALQTLNQLVTWNGIYASTAKGDEGLYYAFFGRDSAEVTNSILQAAKLENNVENNPLLRKAASSLLRLTRWQGTHEDPSCGMQKGKFPHEIRTDSRFYTHLTIHRKRQGRRSWYIDPNDHFLKNWDSNDSTPFITSVLLRLHEHHLMEIDDEIITRLKVALEWCMRNIDDHRGFAGFSRNDDRKWDGLVNHSWKDSSLAYLLDDGNLPTHPIHDVLVNAHMWEALKRGADFFDKIDRSFSRILESRASALKKKFNDPEEGFLIFDKETSLHYYAEAIDGKANKLTTITADPAMALACYFNEESIIESRYINSVVKRIMLPDMYDPDAGIRTYSSQADYYDSTGGYHRGPHTFWPFVSGRIGEGLHHFKFTNEAKSVLSSMTGGVEKFGTCIELFLKNEKGYVRFRDHDSTQVSCTDQAWTAARLYYAVKFFQHFRTLN